MCHDPASASIVIMLRSLKLYGMAKGVNDPVARGGPAFEATTPMLSQLRKAVIVEREVRSNGHQTNVACFDFKSSEINEATASAVAPWRVHRKCGKVVLIVGSGTGKSHIAPAVGVQAIEHYKCEVSFYSAVALINALEQEKALGKAGKIAQMHARVHSVILNGLRYLRLAHEALCSASNT